MKYSEEKITQAREILLNRLKCGDKVYTILKSVSKSGMSRRIQCYLIRHNEPLNITWQVSRVLGYPLNIDDKGIRVNGCGMDMGFALIYNLGRVLFPNGNGKYITHRNGNAKPETDGGYCLKQEWMG